MLDVDESGWARGVVAPLGVNDAWSLLAPEPSSRVDPGRWAHQARTFFRALLDVVQKKSYPAGTLPLVDALEVDLGRLDDAAADEAPPPSRVLVVTVPLDRAPDVKEAAVRGAAAIGGAGFDVLVTKGQRLWQVRERVGPGGDPRAPLAVAGILASIFLAPVVPPGGGTIFGVKGARERLEAAGWRT